MRLHCGRPTASLLAPVLALALGASAQGQTGAYLTPGAPRTSVTVGIGAIHGAFQIAADTNGTRTNETRHIYLVGGVVVELRHDRPSEYGGRLRFNVFRGQDRAPRSRLLPRPGFGLPPPRATWDTARVDPVQGFALAFGFDAPMVGVLGGVASGTWPHRSDHPLTDNETPSRTVPVAEVRIGRVTGWRAELATQAHVPSAAPGPRFRGGLAYTSAETGSGYALGVGDEGVYASFRLAGRSGFELEPHASFGSSTMRQFALSIRKRL